jgi:hypothetical protein
MDRRARGRDEDRSDAERRGRMWENPPANIWPVLAGNAHIQLVASSPRPLGCVRFNWLYPPFNNVKIRRAVMMVASQADYMTAFVGDQRLWNECPSFFTCGGPMANNSGSEWLTGKRDYDKETFDGKGGFSQIDYRGESLAAANVTDFAEGETGSYKVNRDCTGSQVINLNVPFVPVGTSHGVIENRFWPIPRTRAQEDRSDLDCDAASAGRLAQSRPGGTALRYFQKGGVLTLRVGPKLGASGLSRVPAGR